MVRLRLPDRMPSSYIKLCSGVPGAKGYKRTVGNNKAIGVAKPKPNSLASRQVSLSELMTSSSTRATGPTTHGTQDGASTRGHPLQYKVRGSLPSQPIGPGEKEELMAALLADVTVPGTARSKLSSWATWTVYHQRWHGASVPVLPLTAAKMQAVAAQMKAQNYRSFPNYLSALRGFHLDAHHVWTAELERARLHCVASTQRGIGPPRQCAEVKPSLICALGLSTEPLCDEGPVCPEQWAILCSFHLLRGAESASAYACALSLDVDARTESLRLPSSKTDTSAVGCTRTWGCVCTMPGDHGKHKQCPFCAAVILKAELVKRFGNKAGHLPAGLPLFPTKGGVWCERAGFVKTVVAMADACHVDLIDDLGRFSAGEHVWRVTGARMLARANIPLPHIMLVARWGSNIVMRYVADAPIANIASAFRDGTACASGSNEAAAPATPNDQDASLPAIDWTPAMHQGSGNITQQTPAAALTAEVACEAKAKKRTDVFALNTATCFVHLIARRKAWERPRPGRTICGQDFMGRGYAASHGYPLLVDPRQCFKCAKAHEWEALAVESAGAVSSSSDSE